MKLLISAHDSCAVAYRIRAEWAKNWGSIPTREKKFSSSLRGPDRNEKLIVHLHLVSRLRMSEDISHLPILVGPHDIVFN
jgi:hypothetical protein